MNQIAPHLEPGTLHVVDSNGPCTYEGNQEIEVDGHTQNYAVFRDHNGGAVSIPTTQLKQRVRPTLKISKVLPVLQILTRNRVNRGRNPNERVKMHRRLLHSGDAVQWAECARDLYVAPGKEWSHTLLEIYNIALEYLAIELAAALDMPRQGMRGWLESTILNREVPDVLRSLLEEKGP